MDYFPFFFDLRKQPVLLVGGGQVALRKARLLSKAQARIQLVAPDAVAELQALVIEGGGQWHPRKYQPSDLDGVCLVISATDNHTLNTEISQACKARFLPVNVVDERALCSVITPAIIDRSPLVVAISSGGAAPVLARRLRQTIEALVPESLGRIANFADGLRERVKAKLPEPRRRSFWERLLDSPVANLAAKGQVAEAESQALAMLEQDEAPRGEVYLVGAGPGAPDLLTLRALQLMQQADVVLYDRLVSPEIMDKVRRDADRIYVGKQRAEHAVPQGQINQLLVNLAKEGKRVLRLKGGDPFIFGRGGEEIELLAAEKVPFEVVPGITAASGCAAYAGIPLTHRDHAQSVRFITGHLKDNQPNIRWAELVAEGQTLVFYMSLHGLETICNTLIKHGKSPATPAALVERGTTRAQRVHSGTLATLPALAEETRIHAPTLLIIGGVVALQKALAWYQPN
ncbi:siroheme synthase CysG [Simiduia sp. 21SJ11W-1]|uniref:siroheme synthase CysG n=1 Tax=Simiduia sp. 21SJ11W-1 TaxID=2909669 RepID=UPI0020A0CE0A|nr:siroheme synthase CysG [Simiduia sp. 21SJ11W-1]UTA49574.1 siroheme synthase CysG [Simiduia sp. 21SJ11W-1]